MLSSTTDIQYYSNVYGAHRGCESYTFTANKTSTSTGKTTTVYQNSTFDGCTSNTESWYDITAGGPNSGNMISECSQNGIFDDCSDATLGLQCCIILTVVTNFLPLLASQGRASREHDVHKKCMSVVVALLPIVPSIYALCSFGKSCYNQVNDTTNPKLGMGYILYSIGISMGNIPNLIVHLIIPAPPIIEQCTQSATRDIGKDSAKVTPVTPAEQRVHGVMLMSDAMWHLLVRETRVVENWKFNTRDTKESQTNELARLRRHNSDEIQQLARMRLDNNILRERFKQAQEQEKLAAGASAADQTGAKKTGGKGTVQKEGKSKMAKMKAGHAASNQRQSIDQAVFNHKPLKASDLLPTLPPIGETYSNISRSNNNSLASTLPADSSFDSEPPSPTSPRQLPPFRGSPGNSEPPSPTSPRRLPPVGDLCSIATQGSK